MGVKLKKKAQAKAKPTPKTGSLLAEIKSLPQVDVTITSTPVKSKVKSLGTVGEVLKKWHDDVKVHAQKAQALTDMEEAEIKKLVGYKAEDFQGPYLPVYTTPGLLPFSTVSPIGAEQEAELVEWMQNGVQGVLNYLQFEPFDETALVQARSLIEKHFVDTVHAQGAGPPALFQTLGKEAVIYRTSLRLCHALESIHGKFTPSQVKAFNKGFPLPPPDVLSKVMVSGPLPGKGPQEPAFIKSQEELEAAFGKPDVNHYTAILLKKAEEYLKDHPEAVGVGPLDGVGLVQMMPPVSEPFIKLDNGVNKNGDMYPKELLKKVVKKLQPKFSVEAAKDAKEQGLDQAAEDILIESLSPGIMPAEHIDINVVIDEDGTPFLETTCDGKVTGKTLIVTGTQKITQKGYETLDRFGVTLKGAS